MSEVELKQIVKIFPGSTKALDEIDLKVKDRELMVILGPSGCGKSTLLRIVAGLEKATDGRVFIDGQDVTELRLIYRLLEQETLLLPMRCRGGHIPSGLW